MFILLSQSKIIVNRQMQKSFGYIIIAMFISSFLFANHVAAQQQSLRDMLSGNNCPASCYLGIIPGVTTQAELEQILNQNNVQAVPSPIGPSGQLLVYSFPINDSNGFIRNSGDAVYIDVTANKVDQVTILLTNITVQDVLSLYGAPDAVTGKTGNLIIYKSQGLVFATAAENPNLIVAAFLQEAIEGRSILSNFLDTEGCSTSSVSCSIPTATPTDTPTFTASPTLTPTLTATATSTDTVPQPAPRHPIQLECCDKKELLQLIFERIIVNSNGEITRVDLLPPFAYLTSLHSEISEATKAQFLQTNIVCTSENGSTPFQLSDPGRDRTYDPLLKRQVFYR